MSREALRLVSDGPARLVDDTDTGDALPLLAFTLAQLADGIRRGGRLSADNPDPPVLVFAAVPSQRPATLQQSHQPITEMLKKETGAQIRFQTGTDYAAVIEGLRAGKIDVAALGPALSTAWTKWPRRLSTRHWPELSGRGRACGSCSAAAPTNTATP